MKFILGGRRRAWRGSGDRPRAEEAMWFYLERSSYWIELHDHPLGRGGQGTLYLSRDARCWVAKIWHAEHRTQEAISRVEALLRWPYREGRLALPDDLLRDGPKGKVVGFIMPYFRGVPLLCVYNSVAGRQLGVRTGWRDRLRIARMLADLVGAVHRSQLIIGDVNESNFLVRMPSLLLGPAVFGIDSDSYEFEARDCQGVLRRFRCGVGKEPYLAPELVGKDLRHVDRVVHTDLFALAVLIWLLLKGSHPFSVRASAAAALPPLAELIRDGQWPQLPRRPLPRGCHPTDAGIPFHEIPASIQNLFRLAFHDGHADPAARPTASQWCAAIAAWEQHERGLFATARSYLETIGTLYEAGHVAEAQRWLAAWWGRLCAFHRHPGRAQRGWWRYAALTLLLTAFVAYGIVQERPRATSSRHVGTSAHEREANKMAGPGDDRWHQTPKLWRELLAEP